MFILADISHVAAAVICWTGAVVFLSNRLFRNEKGTGAETLPAIVSGIVTGDASVSYWPTIFLPLALVTVPEIFAKAYSAQFSSRF